MPTYPYKVGDKFQILETASLVGGDKVGDIYTIDTIREDGAVFHIKRGYRCIYYPGEFKIVSSSSADPEKPKPTPSPKVYSEDEPLEFIR